MHGAQVDAVRARRGGVEQAQQAGHALPQRAGVHPLAADNGGGEGQRHAVCAFEAEAAGRCVREQQGCGGDDRGRLLLEPVVEE